MERRILRTPCARLFLVLSVFISLNAQEITRAYPRQNSPAVVTNPSVSASLGLSDVWLQFLLESTNRYSLSFDPADYLSPAVFLYTDYFAGGTYGTIDSAVRVDLDCDDPDAGRGTSSCRMTWSGAGGNGYFQFGIGFCISDRPRDIPDFGLAETVRFMARGDVAGRQLQVNVFRALPVCDFQQVASQWFTLTTDWAGYALDLPAGLRPQDLHAVQFLMDEAHDRGGGTVRLDEVRISSEGFDPLRAIQSYVAHWAPTNSPPGTPQDRDLHIYPNRSFLYDSGLAIKVMLASGDLTAQTAARDLAEGRMATAPSCTDDFFDEINSGHALLGDGSPRPPWSLQKQVGDNSWFGLALLDLYQTTGGLRYLNCARDISDWAESNLKAPMPYEGYKGGFDRDGFLVPWRSTEHNCALFELNQQLAPFFGPTYRDRAAWAATFVISMFDDGDGKFWTGTSMGDTINTASIPLDAQVQPFLTLGQSDQYRDLIDWTLPIAWAEANLVRTDDPFTGFTFSTASTPNRVWFEGLRQGCVAYRLLGEADKVQACLDTLRRGTVDGGVLAASSDDLVDRFLNAFYDARSAVAPTSWAWMANMGLNPFDPILLASPAVRLTSGARRGDS